MILIFTLSRPDVFAIKDGGLINGVMKLYKLEKYHPKSSSEKALKQKDFENKILKAIWYKVRRHSNMFLNNKIAGLPFEHYYNFSGKVVDVKEKYIWMINGIDKMRKYILVNN